MIQADSQTAAHQEAQVARDENDVSPKTSVPQFPPPPLGSPLKSEVANDSNVSQPSNPSQPVSQNGSQNGNAIAAPLKPPPTDLKERIAPENGRASSTTEFPFEAPPGAAGVLPTNDLVRRIDHANSFGPEASGNGKAPSTRSIPNGVPSIKSGELGYVTPPTRRSVQFARATLPETPDAKDGDDGEFDATKEKHGKRIISKLKALASPISLSGHARSHSTQTIDFADEERTTPRRERNEEDDYADVSGDDEGDQAAATASRSKMKRKSRRSKSMVEGSSTAPSTPKFPSFSFHRTSSERSPPPAVRPPLLPRNTMSDIPENHRLAFSEDEGRDNLGPSARKRPSGLRRITGMASSSKAVEGTDANSPSPWRRTDRMSSVSAVRWRQLKAGLKLLSTTRDKKDHRSDHAKSAELMAELLAGAPAALLLASMFQRDEHGRKRIPVLLEQLKVKVTDSMATKGDGDDRQQTFRIELEYASALVRMKWVINRTWRDFAKLHYRYKVQRTGDEFMHFGKKEAFKLPKFPRRAVPYLRNFRGLYDDEDEEEDVTAGENTAGEQTAGEQSEFEAEASGTDRPGNRKRRSSFNFVRRTASAFGPDSLSRFSSSFGVLGGQQQPNIAESIRNQTYNERLRKRLELYLQQLINCVIFRPISNRLCKFLELSALGVRLAPDGGYHGKEGFMVIKSSKGVDYRKKLTPRLFVNRHSPKWFLVRQSYIVCVDAPDQLVVYDVFLVDPYFTIEKKKYLRASGDKEEDENPLDLAKRAKNAAKHPNHHQLKITNSERITKLLAKNERQLRQFEESINFMVSQSPWAKQHRFGSYAPVRKKVWAQFLVDGQDYMWNVSRAIANAKDVIYIHDWWLSPELYLRRPAAISQDWRLDRLLKRKADEGVKIFVIVYRNVESAIPISSDHTKASLVSLGPNFIIQRSPNQIRQNTFFWAHHEKVLIVDHCVAFCGGVDLCFGRWDTPEHRVYDDKLTGFEPQDFPRDSDHCQLWPGKDYSNPRVQDFYALDKPYDEMYDRTKVPRMPWHDVGMQMVGQPARDLSRHFVQRWNFLLRQRDSTRPRPMLLPPPDFLAADLEALDLYGTCEVQILRSACDWSLGTMGPGKVEHSIMNAYVESIRESEHLVYMENQFFITSCEVGDTKIENKIGDALVERIIRAHENGEKWRAIIIIPLVPGFQNTVDAMDGSSVRLIMQCQYYSICRGETSIFGRLQREGINPREYIEFYALRQWGEIGPDKMLVTEQLYIHAKIMVVDDRIAIIGSANVNERSMLGSRDSEIAAIVRDTDLIPSRMAGKEYMVSRFAHEFRLRLMREHLGLDICRASTLKTEEDADEKMSTTSSKGESLGKSVDGLQQSVIDRLSKISRKKSTKDEPEAAIPPTLPRLNTSELGLPYLSQLPPLPESDDINIGGPPIYRTLPASATTETYPFLADLKLPVVTRDCMLDPVSNGFFSQVWHAVAENNTALLRLVFRCMPDNEVRTWKEYKEYDTFYERFKAAQNGGDLARKDEKVQAANEQSDTLAAAPAEGQGISNEKVQPDSANGPSAPTHSLSVNKRGQSKRRKRAGTKSGALEVEEEAAMLDKGEAEMVLKCVQGHLVVWPYDWLCNEMENSNWNHPVDHMAPLEIYS